MIGGIYTWQKCRDCGSNLQDNKMDGLTCPNHEEQRATKCRVHFRGIKKRFSCGTKEQYDRAIKFLWYLRGSVDDNRFDPRDYRKGSPLGFENLAEEYLLEKRHLRAIRCYRTRLSKATDRWGNRNIKEINNLDLSKLANDLLDTLASYYVFVIISLLKNFWHWCFEMGYLRWGIDPMPKFPKIEYVMGFRTIIDLETQNQIIKLIHEDVWHKNPKIFVAIQFLRTYIHVRPMELISCNEEHLDLSSARLVVPQSKEGKFKIINLLEEDVILLSLFPRALPHVPLFRYDVGVGGTKPGSRFGDKVLRNTWKRACNKLGIKGVSLYPGTKHSTATGIAMKHSPETAKLLTGHATNKAFYRYLITPPEKVQELHAEIRGERKWEKLKE